jgi:hypothetical protein
VPSVFQCTLRCSASPSVYDTWTAKVAISAFQFLLVTMDGLTKREEGGNLMGKRDRHTETERKKFFLKKKFFASSLFAVENVVL